MPKRRRLPIATLLLALAACAACSSSSGTELTPPSGTSPAPTALGRPTSPAPTAPARDLKPQLLTVADLPAGWAVDNSSNGSSPTTPECLKNLKSRTDVHATSKARTGFVKGTESPVFQQQIAYYGTSASAAASFAAGSNILNGCKDISFSDGRHTFTGSVGALSFPKVGQESAAWQIVLTSGGVNLGFDVVVVHQGSELTLLEYGNVGTPDLDEGTSLVRTAVAKLP